MTQINELTRTALLRTMAVWTSFLALLGCSSTAQNQVVRGPLAIGYTLERDYWLNLVPNNSNGKLIGTHTTSYFKINYQGKAVVLNASEGKKARIWEARFLNDAPEPLDLISEAALQTLDRYKPFEGAQLVNFSPGKTQLVFLGSRNNQQRNRPDYALLAVDFARNHRAADRAYALPFRPSATHFIWAGDATYDWFATYFDWTTDSQGKEVLRVHPYTQPPLWHGRWAQYSGEHQPIRYELKPVLPGMFEHFMDWAKKHYPAIEPKIKRSEGMISAKFIINGSVFDLYVRDDYKSLGLESTDQTLLKTIGDQFDGELRQDRFQDGSGEMDPD